MEKKIVVPEGMLKAATEKAFYPGRYYTPGDIESITKILETALRWLSQNPIVPDEKQTLAMVKGKEGFPFDSWEWVRWGACEWQRRMFDASEPEIPEEIKDLLTEQQPPFPAGRYQWREQADVDKRILEAYRRGKVAAGLEWSSEYQKEKAGK